MSCALGKLRDYPTADGPAAPAEAGGRRGREPGSGRVRQARRARNGTQAIFSAAGRRLPRPSCRR
ncbi:hypothetical protein F01_430084 [Burkholderia cenocepacia]|nr:hypothetical protein F01_430084 [Burkholderia cenocepacia]